MSDSSSLVYPSPYIRDVGVLALVPDYWEETWQLRHQLLTRLSKYFHIVWVSPTPWWRSKGRLQKQSRLKSSHCTLRPWPGLTIYESGILLPNVGRPQVVSRLLEQQRLRQACRLLHRQGCKKIIVYIWRPHFARALDLINHDVSCYHIDDEYTFSPVEKLLGSEEAALISRVNQVFIHSPALMDKKGHINPNTLYVPNGVDYEAFSTPAYEPDDMRGIPRPRIGYVGIIKQQIDFELLITLAKNHREWSFVFVGPHRNIDRYYNLLQALSRMPNVYFIGPRPVDALPGYMQHLDVCILCYVMDDYTKFIYPLKLHEYLSTGRPVVSSPLRSLPMGKNRQA